VERRVKMRKKVVVEMFLVVFLVGLLGYMFMMDEFVENAEVRAVRKKVKAGADVNAKDAWGYTLLHKAARQGKEKVVRELVRLGADVNARDEFTYTALHRAAEYGRVEVVRELVKAGADVNAKGLGGWTPLHKAALGEQVETVKELVRLGADVNAKDNDGDVPSYWVDRKKPEGKEIIEFLEKESEKRRK
jgi:ankyrin repeat protein